VKNTYKIILSSAFTLAAAQLSAAQSYDVIDLGNLGSAPAFVYGLNNNGVAVGYSGGPLVEETDTDGNTITVQEYVSHAYAFDQTAGINDQGAIVNSDETVDWSAAFSINNNDRLVGVSLQSLQKIDGDGNPFDVNLERGIFIDKDSGVVNVIKDFDPLNPNNMRALSINDNDFIVGFGQYNPVDDVDSDGNSVDTLFDRGFIYNINTDTLTRLDPFTNANELNSSVRAINNDGIVTGWAQKEVGELTYTYAFYTQPQTPLELVQLPLFSEGNSYPWAINDSGKIVGKAGNSENAYFVAFLYDTVSDEATELGVLNQNQPFSEAFDINNLDQVVGLSQINQFTSTMHAFIYEDGEMRDLNNLIDCKIDPAEDPIGNPDWTLHSAQSINDSGVIVGNGILNGELRSFMLLPRETTATACQPIVLDDSGSGGVPVYFLATLMGVALLGRRKR